MEGEKKMKLQNYSNFVLDFHCSKGDDLYF